MYLQDLVSRLQDLKNDFDKKRQNISVLSEQLEQEKACFHAINGHISELSYWISEEQKTIDQVKQEKIETKK